jgi:hypothetical protein
MLFLLNDRVLDVGDADATLRASGFPVERLGPAPSPVAVLEAARATFLANPAFHRGESPQVGGLCALIHLSSGANAALFVVPDGAHATAQVGVRLADLELLMIAKLAARQAGAPLDPAMLNREVWAKAG